MNQSSDKRPHRRRRRAPLRHRRPRPRHRLHPQHPRRAAVHPQRHRLRRVRDRDDRPDLARRPQFRWLVRLGLIGYALTDDRRLGHPGPVLLDRVRRQGDRGRAHLPRRGRLPARRRQPGQGRQARGQGHARQDQPPPGRGRHGRLTARQPAPVPGSVRRRGDPAPPDRPRGTHREAPHRHPRPRDRRARGGRLQLHQRPGGTAAPAAPADPNAPVDHRQRHASSTESTVAVPAGKAFQLTFTNQESAPHNVAIYTRRVGRHQPVPRRDLQQRLEGLGGPGARRGQLLLPV